MKTIGQSMRDARQRCGLTVMQLSRLAVIAPSTIRDYEQDKNAPGIYNLMTLADALGVSLDDYVGRNPPKDEVECKSNLTGR